MFQGLLPIFSNLIFIVAARVALFQGLPDEAILFFIVTILSSPSYHLCLAFPKACLFRANTHYLLDFWTAQLSIIVIGLRFIRIRSRALRRWILWVAVISIGMLFAINPRASFEGQCIIAGLVAGGIFLYVLWHRYSHGYWPEYDMVAVTLGTAFISMGVCVFVQQDAYPEFQGYTHSFWHLCVGIGVIFWLQILPPEELPEILPVLAPGTFYDETRKSLFAPIIRNPANGKLVDSTPAEIKKS